MATITINRKDFEKLLGKKLSTEQLKDRIAMLGTSVESIDNNTIEVEIFPNRPDLLSVEGLARALSTFIDLKKGLKNYKVNKSDYIAKTDKKVANVRPCVAAAVIKNIKLTDETVQSIMQLQEKLHITIGRNRKKVSIGGYDLDTITFPLLYTTKPRDFKFIPLEYKEKLTLQQILQRHPKGKEYAHVLENFNEFPIWLDAKERVLSMPPIINSEETRIKPRTQNLFIDVTGLDQNTVEQALNIIVAALADRNSEIYEVKINNKSFPNLKPKKIKLNLDYANKLLGLKLNKNEVKKYLEKMGYACDNNLNVLVPAYRTDILHQIDLIEDIAIAYGYENFKFEIPEVATIGEENKFEVFKRKISEVLVGLNLMEVFSYHITNEKDSVKKMNHDIKFVELENALTEDYNILRPWLIPNLIKILDSNKHNEYPQNIFEIGTVFKEDSGEITRLAVVLCNTEANFTKIKQILDALMSSFKLKYNIEEIEHNSFISGRVGRVGIEGKRVAYIGEINPKVLEHFKLEIPVAALEFNLTELFKIVEKDLI